MRYGTKSRVRRRTTRRAAPSRERGDIAVVAERGRGLGGRGDGDPGEPAADAHPLRAGLEDLAESTARQREDVHGQRDGLAHRPDLLGRPQARRVEDVGARLGERLQPRDGVGQVRVAADVVLRPRRQREREGERACGLDRRGDARDRMRRLVEVAGRVPVLDRAADRPDLRDARDRTCCVLGRGAVAVLEVDGDGKPGRGVEGSGVRDDLVQGDAPVETAEREGEPGARRRERLEAEGLEHPGGPGIPRVRDDERLARVERAECLRLRLSASPSA